MFDHRHIHVCADLQDTGDLTPDESANWKLSGFHGRISIMNSASCQEMEH